MITANDFTNPGAVLTLPELRPQAGDGLEVLLAKLAQAEYNRTPLRPAAMHATYGDEFNGAALDPKWTRVGLVAGDHTYRTRGGSWMDINAGTATGINRLIHQPWTAVNDAVLITRVASAQLGGGHPMWGPMFADNSGAGVGFTWYSNSSALMLANLTGWRYASTLQFVQFSLADHKNVVTPPGGLWLKLRKSGTSYYGAYSVDGQAWSPETAAGVNATAMTKIGVGLFDRFAGSFATSAHTLAIDLFNCDA